MGSLDDTGRQRLSDIATASRDAWETARVHTRKLEDAVLHAVDVDHASVREVATVLGVSPQRVYGIIQNAYKR
jgi:hypothetical protein